MKIEGNILFIEDYEDDYLLLLRHIKKAGHNISSRRVFSKSDLKKALKDEWDAIICDHKLPGLSSFDALKMVRQRNSEVPFIIVSGLLTESEASRAMNSGACDYIIKGDYNRFLPALEREIRDYKIKIQKKEIENQLLEKEEAFKLLTENLQDLMLISDDKGKILYISSSVKRMTGYLPEEVLGRYIHDFISENDLQKFEDILSQIQKGVTRTFKSIYEVKKADGSIIYLDNVIKPFQDGQGQIRFISTSRDFTQTLEFHDQISKSKKQFTIATQELQHLINYANAPIFGIDWNGIINEWNPQVEKITGYNKEEVIGRKFYDQMIQKSHQLLLIRLFKEVLQKKKALNYEIPLFTKYGGKRTIIISATPRRDFNGHITGVICYGQDITEQTEYKERLEQKVEERTKQLKESLAKEKELAALKTRFVSMASHEFKTPLSTISFATEFLERYFDKAPKEKIQERIKRIKEQVQNMIYLLNDVLTFGKTEEGKIKPKHDKLVLHNFIKAQKEALYATNKFKHKISVKTNLPKDFIMITDPVLLMNICSNFLNNAMKYSPGKEQIVWEIKRLNESLIFVFSDYGIGIPVEDQDKIFNPFHRALNSEGIEGTGLGLSIAKRAAESLGGEVRLVESSEKGTTFEFMHPVNVKS